MRRCNLVTLVALGTWLAATGLAFAGSGTGTALPSIVYILADDLGYGDVRALNPAGRIATPHIDDLAAQGMAFTDAHASASVCTPSRYSILTGRYAWRTRLRGGVLDGAAPHLIDPARLTVPALLKQHGYDTACVGKWHLGMDWVARPGTTPFADEAHHTQTRDIDYTRPIENGPTAVGFDYFFGIAGSLNMPPFTFIENDRVLALPIVEKGWGRSGPAAPDFEAVDVLPRLVHTATGYIDRHADGRPFFLYLALTSPHSPHVPTPQWRGRSGINAYADFVMETDWAVGEVLQALDRAGLADRSLVIFASDNGVSQAANLPELTAHGHDPSFVFRGHKTDIWEGGHRVPFLVRWPGVVAPGTRNAQPIGLEDLLATCADLLGVQLPDTAGEDSTSIMPLLRGAGRASARAALVQQSGTGRLAIRNGDWKLALCPGSGGSSPPQDPVAARAGLPPVQLYDLATDVGEAHNVEAQHPDVVENLLHLLAQGVARGRTTPGTAHANDVPVELWPGDARHPDNQGAD